jgi:hypothetical protein
MQAGGFRNGFLVDTSGVGATAVRTLSSTGKTRKNKKSCEIKMDNFIDEVYHDTTSVSMSG